MTIRKKVKQISEYRTYVYTKKLRLAFAGHGIALIGASINQYALHQKLLEREPLLKTTKYDSLIRALNESKRFGDEYEKSRGN